MAFKPMFPTERLLGRVVSLYKTAPGTTLSAGALLDIDFTEGSAFGKSVGYEVGSAGTLKLATVASTRTDNEFGISIVSILPGGVPIIERILGISTNYMTLLDGGPIPVYQPAPGDIIGTDQFVGSIPTDISGAVTGFIDVSDTSKYGLDVGVYNGKFRLAQAGDKVRGKFIAKSTQNGNTVAVFKFN